MKKERDNKPTVEQYQSICTVFGYIEKENEIEMQEELVFKEVVVEQETVDQKVEKQADEDTEEQLNF